MRPKSGLPKRKALRNMPRYLYGFRENPSTLGYRHPDLGGPILEGPRYRTTSLFCGCGGLDLGFLGGFRYLEKIYPALPFSITCAIDINEKAIETYRLNISPGGEIGDLTSINASDLPASRVLLGGFPCQDFSSSGSKAGLAGKRGRLYQVLVDYMQVHQPEIVVAENVPHLSRLAGGEYIRTILSQFESCGYEFIVWELFAPDYGLAQSRRRLFLVGSRRDLGPPPMPPAPTHLGQHVPIEVAIGDLVSISDESITNQSQFFVATRATAGGGQGDHRNERGKVAYCIRANAKARIQFHYELERRLTVRECARLQSFPDEFVFPFAAMPSMEQIGNAVPPLLGHLVAQTVFRHLKALDSCTGNTQATIGSTGSVLAVQGGLFDPPAGKSNERQ
jgi:DNA (cytosine-5)-methyltransferase 1